MYSSIVARTALKHTHANTHTRARARASSFVSAARHSALPSNHEKGRDKTHWQPNPELRGCECVCFGGWFPKQLKSVAASVSPPQLVLTRFLPSPWFCLCSSHRSVLSAWPLSLVFPLPCTGHPVVKPVEGFVWRGIRARVTGVVRILAGTRGGGMPIDHRDSRRPARHPCHVLAPPQNKTRVPTTPL